MYLKRFWPEKRNSTGIHVIWSSCRLCFLYNASSSSLEASWDFSSATVRARQSLLHPRFFLPLTYVYTSLLARIESEGKNTIVGSLILLFWVRSVDEFIQIQECACFPAVTDRQMYEKWFEFRHLRVFISRFRGGGLNKTHFSAFFVFLSHEQ